MTCFKSIGENETGCDKVYSRFKRIEKEFVFANINDINLNNNSNSFTDTNGNVHSLELIRRVGISSSRVVFIELFAFDENPLYPQVDAKNSSIILTYINSLLCNQ